MIVYVEISEFVSIISILFIGKLNINQEENYYFRLNSERHKCSSHLSSLGREKAKGPLGKQSFGNKSAGDKGSRTKSLS